MILKQLLLSIGKPKKRKSIFVMLNVVAFLFAVIITIQSFIKVDIDYSILLVVYILNP